jgi:hypothetical protein
MRDASRQKEQSCLPQYTVYTVETATAREFEALALPFSREDIP